MESGNVCFSITLRISVCYGLHDVCDSELNCMMCVSELHGVYDNELHDVCE